MPNEIFTMYAPFVDKKDINEKIIAQNSESFVIKRYEKTTKEVSITVFSHKMGKRTFKATYNDIYYSNCQFDDRTLDLELIFDKKYKEDLEKIDNENIENTIIKKDIIDLSKQKHISWEDENISLQIAENEENKPNKADEEDKIIDDNIFKKLKKINTEIDDPSNINNRMLISDDIYES